MKRFLIIFLAILVAGLTIAGTTYVDSTGVYTPAYATRANAFSADQTLSPLSAGDSNSRKIFLNAHRASGSVTLKSSLYTITGADPYLAISAPNDAGSATVVMEIHDAALTVKGALILDPAPWTDLRIALVADTTPPSANAPDFGTFQDGVSLYLFDPDTDESLHVTTQLPHAYKFGTDLKPHIHWAPTSTNTGTVDWCLEYSIAEEGAAFQTTATLCQEQAGSGAAKQHQYVALGTIDGSTIDTLSAIIIGRVFRDADDGTNDTYTGDAAGLELDFHYQLDTVGSALEGTK